MAERETNELAAHLSCVLTTAAATIERADALMRSGRAGPGLAALVRDVAFRSLVDDVANANLWLAEQARRTDAVRLAEAEGCVIPPGATLFPAPERVGLPDGRR